MILKNLDIEKIQDELEQAAKEMFVGEEGDRGHIAEAFNDGLMTMMYRACTILGQKFCAQFDVERKCSE